MVEVCGTCVHGGQISGVTRTFIITPEYDKAVVRICEKVCEVPVGVCSPEIKHCKRLEAIFGDDIYLSVSLIRCNRLGVEVEITKVGCELYA
jgi:hypothetical protein